MRTILGVLVDRGELPCRLQRRSERWGSSRTERGTHTGHSLNACAGGDRARHTQPDRRVRRHRALPARRSPATTGSTPSPMARACPARPSRRSGKAPTRSGWGVPPEAIHGSSAARPRRARSMASLPAPGRRSSSRTARPSGSRSGSRRTPRGRSDCEACVASIKPAELNLEGSSPVESGTLVPPPDPAPSARTRTEHLAAFGASLKVERARTIGRARRPASVPASWSYWHLGSGPTGACSSSVLLDPREGRLPCRPAMLRKRSARRSPVGPVSGHSRSSSQAESGTFPLRVGHIIGSAAGRRARSGGEQCASSWSGREEAIETPSPSSPRARSAGSPPWRG